MAKKFNIERSDDKVVLHLPAKPYVEVKEHKIDYPGETHLVSIDNLQTFFYYNYETHTLYADKEDVEKNQAQLEQHEKEMEGMNKEEREVFMQGKFVNNRIRLEHIVLFDDTNVCDLIKSLIDNHLNGSK